MFSLTKRLSRTATLSARTFTSSAPFRMKVVPVPVREDNYAYLLIDDKSNKAAAVDPYTVSKVKAAADQLGVEIVAAITTHHHHDHSGGNKVCDCLVQAMHERLPRLGRTSCVLSVAVLNFASLTGRDRQPRTQMCRSMQEAPRLSL